MRAVVGVGVIEGQPSSPRSLVRGLHATALDLVGSIHARLASEPACGGCARACRRWTRRTARPRARMHRLRNVQAKERFTHEKARKLHETGCDAAPIWCTRARRTFDAATAGLRSPRKTFGTRKSGLRQFQARSCVVDASGCALRGFSCMSPTRIVRARKSKMQTSR